MNSPLSKNFQAKWLQIVNEDFIKIVEAEYECHSDKPFWESRPTRLFAIKPSPEIIEIYQKEYDRLEKVFNSNYYKKECLENIFSDDEVVLKLIDKPRKILPGIVFPAVNQYEADKNFPLVSFSRYDLRSIFDDTGTKGLDSFITASKRLFDIVYNFTSIEYREKLIYFLPQLAFFQTINGDSYQLSLVMQAWYEWNKNSFHKYDMPSICSTGCVSDNGEILPIDKAEIKLEAAYSMGFDYIIFPEGNRKDFENQLAMLENKDKVLFFSHIKEAFEWLSLLTDKNRDIGVIKNWAEKQAERPSSDTFASFFNNGDYANPKEWKKLIHKKDSWIATSPTATQSAPSVSLSLDSSPNYFGGASDNKSFEEKILDKLYIFLEEYCKWANTNKSQNIMFPKSSLRASERGVAIQENYQSYFETDSLYNKYLDDFIKENDDSDLVEVLTFFRENVKTPFVFGFAKATSPTFVGADLCSATSSTSWDCILKKWIATQSTTARNDGSKQSLQINYDKNISDKEQFILEFFRAFCFGEDINAIFQPIVWKSDKFRKLFTTLSIKVLSTNKELLKKYLIEIVSDVDNLIFGFAALK